MNAEQINGMDDRQIRNWLERALNGQEPLPRLTSDESHYLGIIRLDKSLNAAARKSLRDGTLFLLRRFCELGFGERFFVQELLWLAAALKQAETTGILADLAGRFPELPQIPIETRRDVLGALVDASPPLEPAFWRGILEQNPQEYGLLALSGMLAANHPFDAIGMLSKMPDSQLAGQAAVINLELAWDDLPRKDRARFVGQIRNVLAQCGENFAGPVRVWAENKRASRPDVANQNLFDALYQVLGKDFPPRTLTPKLCPAACS